MKTDKNEWQINIVGNVIWYMVGIATNGMYVKVEQLTGIGCILYWEFFTVTKYMVMNQATIIIKIQSRLS